MDGADPVSIRLRRSTPSHDAYTVGVYDSRFAALVSARPADARRWVATTRWLHGGLHHAGRLVVGLGVQWTPTRLPLHGAPPSPATLQLCVGHRCLVFHLAHDDAVPEKLRRFLADPRVTFVGSGSANDRRMLWEHYGLHVERGRELRAVAGMDGSALLALGGRWRAGENSGVARQLGGGAEDEAEAEGEVGVDAGVLDLVRREARRVPGAHGDFPGLVDPGVAEEAVATRREAQARRAWWGAAGSELQKPHRHRNGLRLHPPPPLHALP